MFAGRGAKIIVMPLTAAGPECGRVQAGEVPRLHDRRRGHLVSRGVHTRPPRGRLKAPLHGPRVRPTGVGARLRRRRVRGGRRQERARVGNARRAVPHDDRLP